MEARNPAWANAEHTVINLEWNHPEYGWIPFSALPDDAEEHGRALFLLATAEEFGPVAEYVAPPEPVPSRCTRRQGRLALLNAGYLEMVEASIAAIVDPVERTKAQIEYEADTWERANLFLQAMWAQLGGTPEGLDDLFRYAVTQ